MLLNAYARVYQMHASDFIVSMLQAILRGWTTCPPMHPVLWEQLRDLWNFCTAERLQVYIYCHRWRLNGGKSHRRLLCSSPGSPIDLHCMQCPVACRFLGH